MQRLVRPLPNLRSLPLMVAAIVGGCASGAPADDEPRAFELSRVEIEADGDTQVLVGLDDDEMQISESALFVERETASIRIEHEGEWLTVTMSPLTSDLALDYQRGPWSFAWSSETGGELPLEIESRWAEVVLGWRTALMDRERLAKSVSSAINVLAISAPLDVPVEEWLPICAAVIDWQCAGAPPIAALGCRVAGAAYCEGVVEP